MAKATTKKTSPTDDILKELRAFGLAYPGAHLKSPWPGHLDLAVNDKTFAYLSIEGEPLGISCKLPRSSEVALMLPFCTPTAYGLGKSGWVSAKFEDPTIDVAMLKAWIDESYRAQAPKKLLKSLGAPPAEGAAPAREAATARKPAKEPAPKKAAAKAAPKEAAPKKAAAKAAPKKAAPKKAAARAAPKKAARPAAKQRAAAR